MDFSTGESLLMPEGDTLKEAFTAHLVLPDVVNRLPEAKLHISYSDHVSIELGNLVMPEYTDLKPMISMEMFNEKKLYTLIMTDPDVPNRAMPSDREFLHWMIINITGNSLQKGEEVVEYEAPLPKKGSGLHRYVFVLFEQSKPIVFDKTGTDSATLEEQKKPSVKSMDYSSISDSEQDLQSRMYNQLNVANVKRSISNIDHSSGVLSSRDTSPPKYDSSAALKSTNDKDGKGQGTTNYNDGSVNNMLKSVKEAPKVVAEEKKGLPSKGMDQKTVSVQSSGLKAPPLGEMIAKNESGGDKNVKSVDQKSAVGQQLSKQKTGSHRWLSCPTADAQTRVKTSEEKETAPEFQRTKFSTKDFITKYLIRSVAAGNFFQTEFNDYVGEKLTKSLSMDKEKHTEKLTAVMSTTTTATFTTKTVMTTLEKKIERSQYTSSRK